MSPDPFDIPLWLNRVAVQDRAEKLAVAASKPPDKWMDFFKPATVELLRTEFPVLAPRHRARPAILG